MTWVLSTTNKDFFLSYLQVINGIAKLSTDEMAILSKLMEVEGNITEFDVLAIESASDLPEKKVKSIIKTLIKKGLLIKIDDEYTINERINVTRGNVSVTFELRLV